MDSLGRQWRRWKGGQLPPTHELTGAAFAAVALEWIDEDLNKKIIDAYSERMTTNPTDAAKSGWDLKAVICAFEKYADKSTEMLDQYNYLDWYVNGPDEEDPSYCDWLSLHELKNELIEEDNIDQEIEIELTRMCGELYRYGLTDPCKRVRTVLNRFETRVWPLLKSDIDENQD